MTWWRHSVKRDHEVIHWQASDAGTAYSPAMPQSANAEAMLSRFDGWLICWS